MEIEGPITAGVVERGDEGREDGEGAGELEDGAGAFGDSFSFLFHMACFSVSGEVRTEVSGREVGKVETSIR